MYVFVVFYVRVCSDLCTCLQCFMYVFVVCFMYVFAVIYVRVCSVVCTCL